MSQQKKHQCAKSVNGTSWSICCACRGRIHLPGCTTKLNKHKDCCVERHQMLHEQGQTVGIDDSSVSMLPY